MPKSTKKADCTYWLNLYWDQTHVELMCSPARHWSRQAADNEFRIHRLMFGEDVYRIGHKAHKVTYREAENPV